MIIREAGIEDAKRLLEIYSFYVKNTAVSFEYEPPSINEFENRIIETKKHFPYLICELNGLIVGYAYAGSYSLREAYSWTATVSIYVDREYRRGGIGTMLYSELEKHMKKLGIVNLLAAVAYSEKEDEFLSHDSYLFHEKMGYHKVAHMSKIGKKFDIWYDLLWMQKVLVE